MLEIQSTKQRVYSVSELSQLLGLTLEGSFPSVTFKGEISQVTRASSGHMYFTVKDAQSQLSCVMWNSLVKSLNFQILQGTEVICTGKPNLYPGTGKLQILVNQILPGGLGALQIRFQELKLKLEKEGLFSLERKRSLPYLPNAVGVVTSQSGAVIHDIMTRITQRMPCLQVYLVDVRVQGQGAAVEIASAIEFLGQSGLVDVIIAGRGGGSLEDLWAFNEELVVRSIFRCPIPVISAVGHETDFTLADFVADVRAPTPTAAAEMVIPKKSDLLRLIRESERRLFDYQRWLSPCEQRVDELQMRTETHLASYFRTLGLRLQILEKTLKASSPAVRLNLSTLKLKAAFKQLNDALSVNLRKIENRLTNLSGKLSVLSPLNVLDRGYAIVEKDGNFVRNAQTVLVDDELNIRLAKGKLKTKVLEKII